MSVYESYSTETYNNLIRSMMNGERSILKDYYRRKAGGYGIDEILKINNGVITPCVFIALGDTVLFDNTGFSRKSAGQNRLSGIHFISLKAKMVSVDAGSTVEIVLLDETQEVLEQIILNRHKEGLKVRWYYTGQLVFREFSLEVFDYALDMRDRMTSVTLKCLVNNSDGIADSEKSYSLKGRSFTNYAQVVKTWARNNGYKIGYVEEDQWSGFFQTQIPYQDPNSRYPDEWKWKDEIRPQALIKVPVNMTDRQFINTEAKNKAVAMSGESNYMFYTKVEKDSDNFLRVFVYFHPFGATGTGTNLATYVFKHGDRDTNTRVLDFKANLRGVTTLGSEGAVRASAIDSETGEMRNYTVAMPRYMSGKYNNDYTLEDSGRFYDNNGNEHTYRAKVIETKLADSGNIWTIGSLQISILE